ncbi:MAG: tRNA pseudouridine(55) synthase TruB [Bowdeniella nasicola]|nr:tRNA pseudouridine(55) synthase TruB [Bowdeniella nasicola]
MSEVGFVLVDKPTGPTSHRVVATLRRTLATRKIGHAGTLDPMASGLLLCGVGRATRLLTYLVGLDKTYEAVIRFGEVSDTDDAEGTVTPFAAADHLREADVQTALAAFRGEISQRPSAVSAIKVDGQRAYARVRAGEDVQLAERPVTVHSLTLSGPPTAATPHTLDVRITARVSSGTYIRALARDLGEELGVGGHLTELRRTAVGPFTEGDPLEAPRVRSPLEVMGRLYPIREVSATEAVDLGYGRSLEAGPEDESADTTEKNALTLAVHDGRLVAVLTPRGGRAHPVLVLEAR